MHELISARLEDRDGKLLHAVKIDTRSGAPRVLIFKGKCFQFLNYQSLVAIPCYRVCDWEMLADSAEFDPTEARVDHNEG